MATTHSLNQDDGSVSPSDSIDSHRDSLQTWARVHDTCIVDTAEGHACEAHTWYMHAQAAYWWHMHVLV